MLRSKKQPELRVQSSKKPKTRKRLLKQPKPKKKLMHKKQLKMLPELNWKNRRELNMLQKYC